MVAKKVFRTSYRRGEVNAVSLTHFVYAAIIFLVPIIFLSHVYEQEILKLTVLIILISAVWCLRSYRAFASGRLLRGPRILTLSTVGFFLAVFVTSLVSSQPLVSFVGIPGRGGGAITYVACLFLLHAIFRDFHDRSVELLIGAFLVTHVVVSVYGLFQSYGLDPWGWQEQMAFGTEIASTLGNPNFSSSFLALTLPFLIRGKLNSEYPIWLRIFCALNVGISMVVITYMASFQAQVVSALALFVSVCWVLEQQGRFKLEALFFALPTVGVIIVTPFLLSESLSAIYLPLGVFGRPSFSGTMLLIGTSIGLAITTRVLIYRETKWRNSPQVLTIHKFNKKNLLVVGCVAIVIVVLGLVKFSSLLIEEISSGLEHRDVMWKVAWKVFSQNLLFGSGLETFYSYFSPMRPIEHAVSWEFVVSDNAHSVPLTIFLSGGLFLGCAYLSIIGVLIYFGLRALRKTTGRDRLLLVAVLAAYCAYQLQSLVSIDAIGLLFTQWVLGGILLSLSVPESLKTVSLPWAKSNSVDAVFRRKRSGLFAVLSFRNVVLVTALTAVFVILLWPLTIPLRADLKFRNSEEAYLAFQETSLIADIQQSHDQLKEAIELNPLRGRYYQNLGLIYAKAGLFDEAIMNLETSAQKQVGIPVAAQRAARINRDRGNNAQALFWYEEALKREPYGPLLLAEAASFYNSIGEEERMYDRLIRYESLGNRALFGPITLAYKMLGDFEKADRICERKDLTGSSAIWEAQC